MQERHYERDQMNIKLISLARPARYGRGPRRTAYAAWAGWCGFLVAGDFDAPSGAGGKAMNIGSIARLHSRRAVIDSTTLSERGFDASRGLMITQDRDFEDHFLRPTTRYARPAWVALIHRSSERSSSSSRGARPSARRIARSVGDWVRQDLRA